MFKSLCFLRLLSYSCATCINEDGLQSLLLMRSIALPVLIFLFLFLLSLFHFY
uniref:Uncharacterized protein n=1 Tax=Parascaris equorum TaxID=6256 RepID=A0A914RN07_PAREQ